MSKIRSFKKLNMPTEYLFSMTQCVNPSDPGGEAVMMTVDVYNNGDGPQGYFTNTHMEMHCYGSHVSTLSLYGVGMQQLSRTLQQLESELDDFKLLAVTDQQAVEHLLEKNK